MSLSLISKNLRKYPVLVVCVVLAVVSLGLAMMRGPAIVETESQLQELEREWSNIRTNADRSAGLQDDFSDLNAGLAQIQNRLMHPDEVAANYESFYGLERQSGITVDRFNIGLAADGSTLGLGQKSLRHFTAIPCDFSFRGDIGQVLTFLDLLDRQDFIIRMDLLDIIRPQSEDADTEELNVRLRCYVLGKSNEA